MTTTSTTPDQTKIILLRDHVVDLHQDLDALVHDLLADLDQGGVPIHERWRWDERFGEVLDAIRSLAYDGDALAPDAEGGAA